MSKQTYITTAIPYVNGVPHVGHALDYLLADVYARFCAEQGITVRLQAGTDEHGNKIFNKAASLGIPVEQYVEQNTNLFRDFIAKLGVSPTDFIRTTNPDHEHRVQEIWRRLKDHIYPSTYDGWYCSGCERFITDKEYEENQGVCPDHQAPYERLSEKNYYLRISDFKDRIKTAIESGEMKILPEFRKREILNLLETSPDVSISRPKKNLSWGIPVPDDDEQIMYVWVDALANYITILGYPDQEDISEFWPADVQFVGKDILRFHAIIWPSILMALNLPLPKLIHSHGHVFVNGQKMSKSVGNVIDPSEMIDKYGLDPFRYFFLRHIDTFADSDFTWEKFDSAYAGELANDLGNLVQRLSVLSSKNAVSFSQADLEKIRETACEDSQYLELMHRFEFSKAFDYAWSKLQDLNKEINDRQPWAVAKTDPAAAKQILFELDQKLLIANQLLVPFLPGTTNKVAAVFGETITVPAPLFPKS